MRMTSSTKICHSEFSKNRERKFNCYSWEAIIIHEWKQKIFYYVYIFLCENNFHKVTIVLFMSLSAPEKLLESHWGDKMRFSLFLMGQKFKICRRCLIFAFFPPQGAGKWKKASQLGYIITWMSHRSSAATAWRQTYTYLCGYNARTKMYSFWSK